MELLQKIEGVAAQHPEKTALFNDEGVSYSFSALISQAKAGAQLLKQQGIQPGDRIVLMAVNHPSTIVAFLAARYAQATSIMVDPTFEDELITQYLQYFDIQAIICPQDLTGKLESLSPEPILILQTDAATGDLKVSNQYARRTPKLNDNDANVAVIVLSSGTSSLSGMSKGVLLTETALARNIEYSLELVAHKDDEVVATFLPIYHIFPLVQGVFTPLCRGLSLLLFDIKTPQLLFETLQREQPTLILLVPRIIELIYQKIQRELRKKANWLVQILHGIAYAGHHLRKLTGLNPNKKIFSAMHVMFGNRLERIIIGGAKSNKDILRFLNHFGFDIHEGYGLTESCGVITVNRPDKQRYGSVGAAMDPVEIRLLDPDKNGQGELCVRNPFLLQGYFRDEEASKTTLIDGWLHTGDLAQVDADGFLSITGRKKNIIVTSGGKKLLPEQLEHHYEDPEMIAELAIVGVADQAGGCDDIHIAVTPMEEFLNHGQLTTNIKEKITQRILEKSKALPAYKRIKKIHFLKELPKTKSFKIKHRLLQHMILKPDDFRKEFLKGQA